MMRRAVWLATGMLIGMLVGAGGTLWAGRRVRRAVRSVSSSISTEDAWRAVTGPVRGLAERVRAALQAAREERARWEAELAPREARVHALREARVHALGEDREEATAPQPLRVHPSPRPRDGLAVRSGITTGTT